VIRKTAVVGGAVAATPLITSILAPASYAATTPGCGQEPESVLCCPCSRTGTGNKDECCQIKNPNINLQCVCVKAEGTDFTGNPDDKFCKPSGNPAEGNVPCLTGGAGGTPKRSCLDCCAAQRQPTACTLVAGTNCTGTPAGAFTCPTP
jgi:hypothetical protein